MERQDLLGDDLNLVSRETEPLAYTLEWDETRGEYYELQEWSPEGWTLLETLDPAESFAYELGRLGSGSHHRFQMVAYRGSMEAKNSASSEERTVPFRSFATTWKR